MPEENFEQQARNMADDFRMEPQPAVWQQVQSAIAKPKRKRRVLIWWWLLPICLTGGTILLYQYQYKPTVKNKLPAIAAKVAKPQQVPIDLPDTETNNQSKNKLSGGLKQQHRSLLSLLKDESRNKILKQEFLSEKDKQQDDYRAPSVQKQDTLVVNKETDTTWRFNDSATIAADIIGKTADTIAKTIINDSLQKSSDTVAAVVKTKKRISKKFHFGMMAEVGVASSGNRLNSSKAFANFDYLSGTPQSNPGGNVVTNTMQNNIKSGIDAAIGVALQKPVSRRLQLTGQLTYRYQHFDISQTVRIDSLTSSNTYSSRFSSGNADYQLHLATLYAGINWQFFTVKKYGIGLQTGFDNSWLLTIQHRQDEPLSNLFADFTASNFRRWQPHLYTAVSISYTNRNQTQWQLLPFARFGLKEFRKSSLPYQDNHLVSAGLQVIYFFK